MNRFTSQAQAEDVIMWHLHCMATQPGLSISGDEFEDMKEELHARWSINFLNSGNGIIPDYIKEKRRPNAEERVERDRRISERWLNHL